MQHPAMLPMLLLLLQLLGMRVYCAVPRDLSNYQSEYVCNTSTLLVRHKKSQTSRARCCSTPSSAVQARAIAGMG